MTSDKAAVFSHYWCIFAKNKDAPIPEFRFHPSRKWRFDFAFADKKIAVEVEGNAWNVRGGGRHMQDGDLEKYNQAALLGWRVFRFSPAMLENNPEDCIHLIMDALK